jgi:phosphoribosylformylglycinamidine synthase
MKPATLVLRTAGTNCDEELAYAFELAGAKSERVHLNRLMERPEILSDYQILAIPGGFSYGDDIAAGRIFANQITHHLHDLIRQFIDDGKPVIGVCNGFQVLIKTDLLPGEIAGKTGQNCTLTNNDSGRFVDRWIHLQTRSKKCIWTEGIDRLELPIAHGEGKFVPADESIRQALWDEDRVALVYTKPDGSSAGGRFPDNPNGSVDDIAGVCDASGLVLGLMPHPERYVTALQHPAWSRKNSMEGSMSGSGQKLFSNAVRHVLLGVGKSV